MAKGARSKKKRELFFADVFAGCGGLSLGLMNAGWTGRFAVEKNRDAFNTLAKNLINSSRRSFVWPKWLPKKALTTSSLLKKYEKQLIQLRGKVDLIAGAPPCQGFSLAGRRVHTDPRNSLFRQYLEIVRRVQPRLLLVENVQGFSFPFRKRGGKIRNHRAYSEVLSDQLNELGYSVFSKLIDFSAFGVPQNRNRFILIAIRNGDPALEKLAGTTPFEKLSSTRRKFLASRQLQTKAPIGAKQAIGDLEVKGKALVAATGQVVKGFHQIHYATRGKLSRFVKFMRVDTEGAPDSMRLARHGAKTIRYFRRIMDTCERGRSMSDSDRKRLRIKKRVLTPLHAARPASTVTTLPDDIIHYSEPRILTVRENARLQTFPDWFEFTGKYTTGSKQRRHDCPRYTQVGNAVPPLFGEAIGLVLRDIGS